MFLDRAEWHRAFQFLHPLRQMHDLFDRRVPERQARILMTGLRAHCDRVTVRPAPDDLEGQVGLMTVDADEHADINLVVPDREVRVVRINLYLRVNLGILGPVIEHRNQHWLGPCRRAFLQYVVQVLYGLSLLLRLLIPRPEHKGPGENRGYRPS